MEIYPREMIKDSSKDFIRMFNRNIIKRARSEVINRRMRLNKQRYTYKTMFYRHTVFIIWENAISNVM